MIEAEVNGNFENTRTKYQIQRRGEPVSNSAGSLCVKITRHETATPVSHSAVNPGKDPNTKYS